MRKLLITALCVSVASAGWVYFTKTAIGNGTGDKITGTAADTWFMATATLAGATNLAMMVYADSVVDSLPNFTLSLQYKAAYEGASWVSINGVLGVDSIMPLEGWLIDTLTGGTGAISYHTMFWSRAGDSSRMIITGKRATQNAKNCSLGVRAWRE